jgi:hypothetical protein
LLKKSIFLKDANSEHMAGNEVGRKFATPGRSIAGIRINTILEDAAVS